MNREDIWKRFNEQQVADYFYYLRMRREDEHGYEDINDYLIALKQYFPTAYKISKKPFAITCKADDGEIVVGFKCKGNYFEGFGKFISA